MIHIRELDQLVLRVVDLERMVRFYCDVLGWLSNAARTPSAWFSCVPGDRSLT